MGFELIAASILDQSATALAGKAAHQLLETQPALISRYAPNALASWQGHLVVRIRELAVAVELSSPALFGAAVNWTRSSFQARGVAEEDFRQALLCLQTTLREELPAGGQKQLDPCLEAGFAAFDQPSPAEASLGVGSEYQRMALAYIETCLSGNPAKAIQDILAKVEAGMDVREIYLKVISQAHREVGRLWHEAKLGVHEEHLITATTFSLMTLLVDRSRSERQSRLTVLGAALGDDAHDVGVRMIMDLFELEGWRAISLGSHLPGQDLARAARDFKANLLVLSATLITHLIPIRAAIREVKQMAPGAKVLVGGLAFNAAPDIWRAVEADGYAANAAEAVEAGFRLLDP